MAENDVQAAQQQLGPHPDHIVLWKNDITGKTYVINEVLNYYQRKSRTLTRVQANNLPHHEFEITALEKAKQILLDLWNWKGLVPSIPNDYIIKNLAQTRLRKRAKPKLANDILSFLETEDGNLDIIFLTEHCEVIPTSIHESQAMYEVYLLLHQTQADYNTVMDILSERDLDIRSHKDSMDELKLEVRTCFQQLMHRLDHSDRAVQDDTNSDVANGDSEPLPRDGTTTPETDENEVPVEAVIPGDEAQTVGELGTGQQQQQHQHNLIQQQQQLIHQQQQEQLQQQLQLTL